MSTLETAEEPKLLPCSFQIHSFKDEIGEVKMKCQIIKMDKSLYLWVGDSNSQSMNDLALAFVMEHEAKKPVVSTKIMGSSAEDISTSLASRLSKKSGQPIYVSYNLTVDNITLPNIEKRIHAEFKKHPELLAM